MGVLRRGRRRAAEPFVDDSYAWNGRHVDFHRCRTCGCVTHWVPRATGRERRGVNARLFPPVVLAQAKIRHRDGAGSGRYLDEPPAAK